MMAQHHDPSIILNVPLSDQEINNLLTSTLHGPLPKETLQRVFATLAEVPALRKSDELLRIASTPDEEDLRWVRDVIEASGLPPD